MPKKVTKTQALERLKKIAKPLKPLPDRLGLRGKTTVRKKTKRKTKKA